MGLSKVEVTLRKQGLRRRQRHVAPLSQLGVASVLIKMSPRRFHR
jgi:hypothetical protein